MHCPLADGRPAKKWKFKFNDILQCNQAHALSRTVSSYFPLLSIFLAFVYRHLPAAAADDFNSYRIRDNNKVIRRGNKKHI